jgi:hypothetical protein
MSSATLDAIEAAILAHHRDTTDPEEKPERFGAVVTGWVVSYETSNIVDVGEEDGGKVIGYTNDYVASDTSPNQIVNLAHWAGDQIAADAFDYSGYDE